MNRIKNLITVALIAFSFQAKAQSECITGDCINGYGEMETQDQIYKGTFSNGEILKGKLTDKATGNIQDGSFSRGQLTNGKIIFSNGTVLQGKFIDGKLNGDNCMRISDGITLSGQFLDGDLISGRFEDQAGNIQEGSFKNGALHGKNCFIKFADGSTFRGEFDEGKRVKGKLTFAASDPKRLYYEGEFKYKEDKPYFHGKGLLHLKNGNDPIGPNWVYNDPIGNGEAKVEIPEGKLGIELKREGGVYLIKGNITRDGYNHTYDFVFDTGASLVSVPFSVVKLLYQQKIITDADFNEKISLQTASGDVVSGMTFNIKELELKTTDGKSVRLFNVEAVVKTDQIILESLDLAAEPPILLGQSAISKLKKIEIDFEQNLLLINN
jgi:hypothetical protein